MNKREKIKTILKSLMEKTKKNSGFHRYEIERAIQVVLLASDQRTIDNWFNLLWKLELFEQPMQDKYDFCWDRLVELEVALPVDLSPNQRRLTNV